MIRSFDGTVPEIDESSFVDESAVVVGDVKIEADASIWPGAVLRGDHDPIIVREGANVQDNATLHDGAEIGPYATVGHNAIVHNATIERKGLVGMGAIILDDVTVGEQSIVGANSLVTEGTVPESVLVVGSPADVAKEFDEPPSTGGEHYARHAKRYAETSEIVDPGSFTPDD